MIHCSVEAFAAACGGRWLVPPVASEIVGVGIDTRDELQGKAFVAIHGERFDGHEFLNAATRAGASVVVVHRDDGHERMSIPAGVLLVDDTKRCLHDLASWHRSQMHDVCVIGVTGSCGKTTTKELIHHVLSGKLRGTAARRSFNNDIGVPLTLLGASCHDDYVVAELGTNAPGEIDALAQLVRPDIAVLTTVGPAHIARFGSVEAIAHEKLALHRRRAADGCTIVNGDVVLLADVCVGAVTFGESFSCDWRLHSVEQHELGSRCVVNDGVMQFDLPLPGFHNALNALAAVAVANHLGLALEDISRRLADAQGPSMRMDVSRCGSITLFNDAYNANPQSMEASISTFLETTRSGSGRVLVLGEMLELGAHGPSFHRALGTFIAASMAGEAHVQVVLVGPAMRETFEELIEWQGSADVTHLKELNDGTMPLLRRACGDASHVLLKGSRGVALERVADSIAAWQRASAVEGVAAD